MTEQSTTFATVETPAGTGAIALIRVTGPRAYAAVETLCGRPRMLTRHRHRNPEHAGAPAAAPAQLHYAKITDGDDLVDDVILAVRPDEKPVVEICAHGGFGVVVGILHLLQGVGVSARRADDGGVTSAESPWSYPALGGERVRRELAELLPAALTPGAAKYLAWQRANLPAAIQSVTLEPDLTRAAEKWRALQDESAAARLRINGVRLAIVGPANAGKSTLFNQLAARDAAVVSEYEGTTRDWVEQLIEMQGVPIFLVDTAGLRAQTDAMEQHALRLGFEQARTCDVVLLLLDSTAGFQRQWTQVEPTYSDLLAANIPVVLVANKWDRPVAWQTDLILKKTPRGQRCCRVSALTGAGLPELQQEILASCGISDCSALEPALVTARQLAVAAEVERLFAEDSMRAIDVIVCQLL